MKAVAETWRTTGGRVIPLAPSAAAAEVLGEELGCRAENLHKFQHAHTAATPGAASGAVPNDEWFVLQPGDLVLVDEAGMAGTRILDWTTSYARERGAVVRLIGDPAQLTSVEAGGALRLITHDTGAVELTDLHRFTDPEEAAATIGLREGRSDAIDFYTHHDRIRSGARDAMLEAAYDAWATDTRRGLASLLIAESSRTVTALNTRARLERIAIGQVEAGGVDLHDRTRAGVGDQVVTRKNHRHLTSREERRFVKNGDSWTVTARHTDGGLTVRPVEGVRRGEVRLPHDYVATHVELGYATTTARAQGRTVDTTHALVDDTLTREALYVAATRARHRTNLYVQTQTLLGVAAEHPLQSATAATDVLAAAITREGMERTATEVSRRHTTGANTARSPQPVAATRPKPDWPYPARPGSSYRR